MYFIFISEIGNGAVYRYLHVYGYLNLQKGEVDSKTSLVHNICFLTSSYFTLKSDNRIYPLIDKFNISSDILQSHVVFLGSTYNTEEFFSVRKMTVCLNNYNNDICSLRHFLLNSALILLMSLNNVGSVLTRLIMKG